MRKFRILALDTIAPEGLRLLDDHPAFEYSVQLGLKGEPLRQALAEFDGAIVRSGVQITADALEGNHRLRAIVRAGVGTDNIDKVAATRLGIVVMNTPAGNTLSTAEHTFALMLAQSRAIAPAYQSLLNGKWDRKSFMGTQLADKTLGIVGMGRIGREVALRAQAFQMRVLAFDPFLTEEQAGKWKVEKVDAVRDMLPRVDYLTVHTPLTPETRDLIGMPELELLKPGVRLINCARGGIFNEAALVAGLKSGRIGGVALDVFTEEPCTNSPLFGMPGVVCTPHLGASTEEAQTQVAIEGIQLLMDFFQSGAIRQAVNMSSLEPKVLDAMRGYLDAAHRLGMFLAQWHQGPIESCVLQYRGELAETDSGALRAAFCAGLLERAIEEPVNIVNAELLLRERGIELVEKKSPDRGAFRSSLQVEIGNGERRSRAGVTLFGNRMPRLILVDQWRLEAYLDGRLLVFTHDDRPGIIGRVGTIFGKYDVNIANMSVGREQNHPGGGAVGILNLDSVPPPEAMQELEAWGALARTQMIELPPLGVLPSWLLG